MIVSDGKNSDWKFSKMSSDDLDLIMMLDETITDSQAKEYEEAFRIYDKDASGFITTRELKSLMRCLGCNPTDSELQQIVNEVDADGNGQIDLPEFVSLMLKMKSPDDEVASTRDAFNVFDSEGKGYIYTEHLRDVILKSLDHVSPDEINEMLECAGLLKDKHIVFEEFSKLVIPNGFGMLKEKVVTSSSNLAMSEESNESH